MPGGSGAVPEAMRAARSGPLDYATVYELIRHAPGNLPPRPEMLGPSPGGSVFWEGVRDGGFSIPGIMFYNL